MFSISDETKGNIRRSIGYGIYMGLTTGIFVAGGLFASSAVGCPSAFDWKTVGCLGAVGSLWEAYNRQRIHDNMIKRIKDNNN